MARLKPCPFKARLFGTLKSCALSKRGSSATSGLLWSPEAAWSYLMAVGAEGEDYGEHDAAAGDDADGVGAVDGGLALGAEGVRVGGAVG